MDAQRVALLIPEPAPFGEPAIVRSIAATLGGPTSCSACPSGVHGDEGVIHGLAAPTRLDVVAERLEVPVAADDDAERRGVLVARKEAHPPSSRTSRLVCPYCARPTGRNGPNRPKAPSGRTEQLPRAHGVRAGRARWRLLVRRRVSTENPRVGGSTPSQATKLRRSSFLLLSTVSAASSAAPSPAATSTRFSSASRPAAA